jgi:transcriptional regulator with XRE-family HTH domain
MVRKMSLGMRLAELRKSRDLTQHELADKLNIGKSTLAMYETDKREPSSEGLIAIADFFGVTIDFLLKGDPRPQEQIIRSETQEFLKRINELDELQRAILKQRVDELINKLKEI